MTGQFRKVLFGGSCHLLTLANGRITAIRPSLEKASNDYLPCCDHFCWHGQATIKKVNNELPLSQLGLTHIKRIRKHPCEGFLELVAGPVQVVPEEVKALASECSTCKQSVFEVYVPSLAPFTPEHARSWSMTWPVIYKPQHIQPHEHSVEDRSKIQLICREALTELRTVLFDPRTVKVVTGEVGTGMIQHPTIQAISLFEPEDDQYYCTGMWAFLYEEPCPMCAMALVHSRLERVYFYKKDRLNGAFTVHRLHLQPLNHMYRVFKLSREEFIQGP